MAVSTSSYFSNSIVGEPELGADIDIFDTTANPKYAVGFGFTRGDGNRYRYCHFGALSPAGNMVATDNLESSTTSTQISAALVSPTLITPSGENVGPNVANSRYMQILVTATADQFAGGYITINAGSGTGYTYRIKGNTATGNPSTGYTYLELNDKLKAPVDTTTSFRISGSPYANLEPAIAVTSTTGFTNVAGATVVGNTAASYGWICTHGIHGVLASARVGSHGSLATLSTNTAGAVSYASPDVTTTANGLGWSPVVGYFVNPASAAGYAQVYLTLE